MFHGGFRYSTEGVKCFTEGLNIRGRGLDIPRTVQIFHRGG